MDNFYVAYVESLIVSGCGYLLLNGVLQGSQDYSALQQWVVEMQFVMFGATFVLQLLLSSVVGLESQEKENDEDDEYKEDDQVQTEDQKGDQMQNVLGAVANAYCTLCFMTFLLIIGMFSRANITSATLRHTITPKGSGVWYFHPIETCSSGIWQQYPWVNNTQLTGDTTCLTNHPKYLTLGLGQTMDDFKNDTNVTDALWYVMNEWSHTIQMVYGNSYAASEDENAVTSPPIAGVISYAVIMAFQSVILLLASYAARSSTPRGTPCLLFLAPRSIIVCNGFLLLLVNDMYNVYSKCHVFNDGIQVVTMFFYLLGVLFGDIPLHVWYSFPNKSPIRKASVTPVWDLLIATVLLVVVNQGNGTLHTVWIIISNILTGITYTAIVLNHLSLLGPRVRQFLTRYDQKDPPSPDEVIDAVVLTPAVQDATQVVWRMPSTSTPKELRHRF
jgi:hypothetical protein